MTARSEEMLGKIELIRQKLHKQEAVCLRGVDWFAWLTAGGSNAVLLAAETGIAEVLISVDGAWIITDQIEAERLQNEELPCGVPVYAAPWAYPARKKEYVQEATGGAAILSDRPLPGESWLRPHFADLKRHLAAPEIKRYQEAGKAAAEAMTEAMQGAAPEWTEAQLAATGAQCLLARGIQPALILAAGERRLTLYRHPTPTNDRLGKMAMMVFCARRYGLYANLTRFISFGKLAHSFTELHRQVREVEAAALRLSFPGVTLNEVYNALKCGYAAEGYPKEINKHHQGGTTGYLPREIIARPDTVNRLTINTPVAWSPSLPGAKSEDTFIVTKSALLNVTVDGNWPTTVVQGINRPLVMER